MVHRRRAERRRRAQLALLRLAREEDGRSQAVIRYLAAQGLIAPDEAAVLAREARRDTVTRALLTVYTWSRRYDIVALAVMAPCAAVVAWLLVGGSRDIGWALVFALESQLFGALTWQAFVVLQPVHGIGPQVLMPPRWAGDEPRPILADAKPSVTAVRIVYTARVVVPPIVLAAVIASPLSGPRVVAAAALALTAIGWLAYVEVMRVVVHGRVWRHLVPKDRSIPLALAVALELPWMLARADSARSVRHGCPLFLVAYFRTWGAYNPQFLFSAQWTTGSAHGRRRRREIVRTQNAFVALTERYADRFEQVVTPAQLREAVLEIRDHLRKALAGDLSFLALDDAPPWWRRTLPRVLSAVVLAAAAIALPYLPGVTASGGALAGIQVGLAVTAVLTLVGTPAEAQKSVAEAVKSASAGK